MEKVEKVMRKKLMKDIKLKNGGAPLLKGTYVEVSPIDGNPFACSVLYEGRTYILRINSVFSRPSMATFLKWEETGIYKSVGGKKVEPDGYDPEGFPSWGLVLSIC